MEENYLITIKGTMEQDGERESVELMTRFGKVPSQLVIEKGVRHICHYETGFGSVSLGVAADVIELDLTDAGGRRKFS